MNVFMRWLTVFAVAYLAARAGYRLLGPGWSPELLSLLATALTLRILRPRKVYRNPYANPVLVRGKGAASGARALAPDAEPRSI
jgi:hypothetical protein